jgi:hypothetical protein
MIISKYSSLALFEQRSVMPVMLISCLVLTGCASTVKTAGKVAEVIYNPDIQVGPNEVQLSKVSLAALSDNVLTTLLPKNGSAAFATKVPANYYLLSLYELDQFFFKKAQNGVLSANDTLAVIDGGYLAKHQYYLKLNGYRFIKHFAVDEDVKGLFAVVNYQQPKCVIWSSVQPITNIGEEYNLYLQGQEQGFTLRSEKDVTAPGEPLKIDNRFFGQCEKQANAVAGSVNLPMSKLVASYMQAATVNLVTPAVLLKPDQVRVPILANDVVSYAKTPATAVLQSEVLSMTTIVEDYQYSTKDNATVSPVPKAVVNEYKAPVTAARQPKMLSKTTIVEDYQYPTKDTALPVSKTVINELKTPVIAVIDPTIVSNTTIIEDYQPLVSSVVRSQNIVKSNKTAEHIASESIEQNLLKETQLDSSILTTYPVKINEHGHRVYFMTGLGYIKTKGNALVIRVQPDVDSQKLSVIGNAKSLQVQRYSPSNDGWLYIESEGVTSGWVRASFVNWHLM